MLFLSLQNNKPFSQLKENPKLVSKVHVFHLAKEKEVDSEYTPLNILKQHLQSKTTKENITKAYIKSNNQFSPYLWGSGNRKLGTDLILGFMHLQVEPTS